MPRHSTLGFCLLVLALAGAGPAAADNRIGSIKEVSGEAFIVADGARRAAIAGGPIFPNDTLETGADGALGVLFVDDSRLSIGADTRLTIDEYVFVPKETRGTFLSRLSRGTLLYVSGLIAKLAPEAVAVETPVGTIGMRGTKLLVEIRWADE